MSNFDLASLALSAVCPGNELLYDDKGMPSVMVRIPKMTYKDLGLGDDTTVFPAFRVNGKEVDCIWISKYQNIVQNGRAYSLPAQDPANTITCDAAREACNSKGQGWHCMTRYEYALLAHWCKANGTMPNGNNNYGKDTSETTYKAIPSGVLDGGKTARVLTGTGPLSWSHDGTPAGIWDLNGNVWEWNTGIRFVYGELQVLPDNNAADSTHDLTVGSTEWRAIDATSGGLIVPDGAGTTSNSLKLDYLTSTWTWIPGQITSKVSQNRSCAWENITTAEGVADPAKKVLHGLGLLKYGTGYGGDVQWGNNGEAERGFFSGGDWSNAADAGVFAGNFCNSPRSYAYWLFGFRSAFVQLPTD